FFFFLENGEGLQVLHYDLDQKYGDHQDYFDDPANLARGGNRIATVLMYLSDVKKGGETVFPSAEKSPHIIEPIPVDGNASECGRRGVAVKPRKGDALLFFSLHPNATADVKSVHSGCPVVEGEKWSATKWIRVGHFDKRPSSAERCADEHENCGDWAASGECDKNSKYMVGSLEHPGYCRKSCNAC
ncbi:hypothetical protein M569_16319, partial [Genlisea aurea]